MCGIAGMVDARLGLDEGRTTLQRMLESIHHRGPDRSATWIDLPVLLGHNRLSIIDLSARANQPMLYDDLVIVYNGEIYNYLELRSELANLGYRFQSESDTEVILAAYKAWGDESVSRFIGMWAFAIWDRTKRELFCSRDRFGIKPFYYLHAGDRFYFGSEYRPLKCSPLFDARLNRAQLRRCFEVGTVAYHDETYYQTLKALPERCNLRLRNGQVTVSPYWDVDTRRTTTGTFEEKADRFRDLFRDSIRLQMRSDVPVGAMLSGGIDSASIASTVAAEFPDRQHKTFTIYYQGGRGMDERPWASEVVSSYPNLEPVVFTADDDEIASTYDTILDAHEAPLPNTPAISSYLVMREASRAGLKVILDGQGGDEYLAGYPPAYDRVVAEHIRRFRWGGALRALNDFRITRHAGPNRLARLVLRSMAASVASEQMLLLGRFRPNVSELLRTGLPVSLPPVPGSRLNQYSYHLIFGWFLPSLLYYGDRMSMAFSVECRVPFLDHRLVEFCFALDDTDRIRRGRTKAVVRRGLSDVLPRAIGERRDKQPFFGGELAHWLQGPLRHLVDQPMRFGDFGLPGTRKAEALAAAFRGGDMRVAQTLWNLAGLNYWLSRQ